MRGSLPLHPRLHLWTWSTSRNAATTLLAAGRNALAFKLPAITWLATGLLAVAGVMALSGFSYAGALQLISLKEHSPGSITATVGVRSDGTLNSPEFRLIFDGGNEVKAGEVKTASFPSLEPSVILCIDQSGSMGQGRIKQVQEALRNALDDLSKPEGRRLNLALWTFDENVTSLRGFSEDIGELSKVAGRIGIRSERDRQTKLYDAIELGLSELQNDQKKGPKHLILITDGNDDGSSITDRVVINEANARGVVIDAIGFGKISDHNSDLLAGLAKSTDGYFIHATSLDQLSRELRKLLSLPPTQAFDVSFQYSASASLARTNTAQLEFTVAGQSPLLLNIQQPLSAPRLAKSEAGASEGNQSKQGEEKKFDLSILLWIVIGLLAIVGVYLLSRGKGKEEMTHEIIPEPGPTLSPVYTEPESLKHPKTMVAFVFPPPGKGQPAAYLDGITGKARGERFPIEQKITHIGAGDDNELPVDDEYVSRRHAAIRYDSGNLYLSDSGSRNKTFLNDAELHQTAMALTPGDQIRVGKTAFQVRAPGDPAPQPHDKTVPPETRVP